MTSLLRYTLVFFGLFVAALPFTRNAAAEVKTFSHFATEQSAEEFKRYLKTQWPTAGNTAQGWKTKGRQSIKAGNPREATGHFASSVVLEESANTWLALAHAYLAIRPLNYSEKRTFWQNARSSAYLAYQTASKTGVKAEALAALGESYSRLSEWRPAIDSYRISLALQENASLRATYETVLAQHGFRMLNYTVDSEAATPRLCVQFSETLARGRIDFAKFVSVNGADPAGVRVEDNQLCVEELAHGKRYQIKIRDGVPSAVEEDLAKPIELTIYVRDRKPAVRFTTQNYVLPRTGQQGIPVVAVNTKAIDVAIYSIGDRRIVEEVLNGSFGQQVANYQINDVKNNKGQLLWKGRMPVKTKLNEETTIAFPIDELLPNLKPGLYMMTGIADDRDEKTAQAQENLSIENYEDRATQWFVVSDLGLTALNGADGVHAFVRSLSDASSKEGIEVRLIARNNEVLGTVKTDGNGHAHFEAGLTRGQGGLAPAMVVVRDGQGDYGFLDITKAAFDLGDRGVGGRTAPGPLDAYVFTERGVYRSGEKVYITALLRDEAGKAVSGVPLTLKIFRPDGVEHGTQLLKDEGDGGRSLTFTVPTTAATGTWRLATYADPKKPAIGNAAFLVEDYTPERLEMTLTPASKEIAVGAPASVKVEGRYLYGAPASNLVLEGELVVKPRSGGVKGYEDYVFGIEDDQFSPNRTPLENLPSTDAEGAAQLKISLPELPQTSKLLAAQLDLRLREASGRVLARNTKFDVRPAKSFVGLKPAVKSGEIAKNAPAEFDVVVLAPDGNPSAAKGLTWELSRIESRFQWYNRNGSWEFEHIQYQRKVANGTLDTSADKPAHLSVPTGDWGRFRLEIASADGKITPASTSFSSGWYTSEAGDTPDILDLALDKASYKLGDTLNVQLSPRMAGKATVAIVSGKLIELQNVDVPAEGATVSFTVSDSWGSGTYVMAELYRPMDTEAKRMPGRAIGVKWVALDNAPRTLNVALALPEKTRPNQPLSVPVTVSGLSAGEKAHITVAAVDLGILNLTNYPVPKPDNYFYGQRRLGMELRDLYGKLIDGMQGTRGTIRSGGDGSGMVGGALPTTVKPVALYSGIVEVDANGKAEVKFDVPAFDGTLRFMAAAWNSTQVGHGTKDIIVRDPVVVQGTPPKFLIIGDKSELHFNIANVEGPEGDYELAATSTEGIKLLEGATKQTFKLAANERKDVVLPLFANNLGESSVTVALTGPGDLSVERSYDIPVTPAAPNISRRSTQTLSANTGTLSVTKDLVVDLIPGSAKVTVNAGVDASLDVPGLLLALDRYPYGCAEQTVSRALPLLYLNEVADANGMAGEKGAKERVEAAIERVAMMQNSSGSFSLWSSYGAYDVWLTAYVTDFLVRAQEKGYKIPSRMYETAIDYLKNNVSNTNEFESGGEDLAYAFYVLARAGRAVIGELRYYVDEKLENFTTPMARAQLGAAMAMYGDKERAERAFTSAIDRLKVNPDLTWVSTRLDYGSSLRDSTATLALISEAKMMPQSVPPLVAAVARRRVVRGYTSTQENAWMLLAAKSLMDQGSGVVLEVNGKQEKGTVRRVLKDTELAQTPLTIKNTSDRSLTATVLVNGASTTPEPASSSGFTIERKVYTPDGKETKLDKVKQNQRIVVVLTVKEDVSKYGHIIVEDRLPAGFEIENPKLLKGSDVKAFSWLDTKNEPTHTSFRDDRFSASFTKNAFSDKKPDTFTMAYVMRAVAPGSYTHPGAYVEDMYRPDRFARTEPGKVEIVK